MMKAALSEVSYHSIAESCNVALTQITLSHANLFVPPLFSVCVQPFFFPIALHTVAAFAAEFKRYVNKRKKTVVL